MFKPIPVAIGLRYLRAKRRNGFISFISLASILGIALGVAALITTLAVMSGFQREIRDRMLQMAAHATISADGASMQNWRQAVEEAYRDKRVAGAAPYIEAEALITGPQRQPAIVRGVIPAEAGLFDALVDHPRLVRVVALSGGFSRTEACAELAKNRGMIASFSRALLSDLRAQMSDAEFDASLGSAIDEIYTASVAKG